MLKKKCLSQSWYMSIEMQLFFIAPALIYSYHRFRTKTIIVSMVSIIICMGWTWALYVINDLTKMYEVLNLFTIFFVIRINSLSFYRYQKSLVIVYIPTHIRFPPWLIGFITGCLLVDYPIGSVRIPKVWV